MRKTLIALLMAGLMVGVAAAQNTSNDQNHQNQQNQATESTQNGREVLGGTDPQQRIQREVLHELLMLPYYSVFDDLKYEVNGNTVTLMGAVTNPTLKSDAESRVKKIEGVQNVV
ncbi:MAG: BON domain-containing protein, partial [Terriglobales bacterium]